NASVADSDPDSPGVALRPVLVAGPINGSLQGPFGVNPDGSFTYVPGPDFYGTDTFTYMLVADAWPRDPTVKLSADSATVTVTFGVNAVNDVPSFARGADETVLEDSGPRAVNWATSISAGPANETSGACAPAGSFVCNQLLDFI